MAVHTFNYTYTYVGVKTMPRSLEDDTQIVREVCVEVKAVDKADATKTLTENMHSPLDGVYSYKHEGLPENFINVADLTHAKVIEWYQNTVETTDLDIYFTWQLYGAEEVAPINDLG